MMKGLIIGSSMRQKIGQEPRPKLRPISTSSCPISLEPSVTLTRQNGKMIRTCTSMIAELDRPNQMVPRIAQMIAGKEAVRAGERTGAGVLLDRGNGQRTGVAKRAERGDGPLNRCGRNPEEARERLVELEDQKDRARNRK